MIAGITIDVLRVRAGVPVGDNSRDVELEMAADQALALCETFCDRWFEKKPQTEQIWPIQGSYLVKRWPIESITTITDANGAVIDPGTYRTIDDAGIVLRGGCAIGGAGVWPLSIVYVGGFDPLPKDLEFALLAAFDAVWSSTPGWGATAGSSAEQVQKISVVGVGSIDFGTGGTTSGGSAGGTQYGSQPAGVLPAMVTSVLQRYMNHTVIGGG
jgi:hypothetical protein